MNSQKEKRKRRQKVYFKKKIAEIFPNLGKVLDIQVHEAHRSVNKINLKRSSPRHIIIKLSKIKDKERILKATREKMLGTFKGTLIRLSTDFSAETLQSMREGVIYLNF